jgi:hypothetical protein
MNAPLGRVADAMALDSTALAAAAASYVHQDPRQILPLAMREYGPDVAISFSGAEDVVLVDMAMQIGGTLYSRRNWTQAHRQWVDSLTGPSQPSAWWSRTICWRSNRSRRGSANSTHD